MKIAKFSHEGLTRLGVVEDDEIVALGSESPKDLLDFLEGGAAAMQAARQVLQRGGKRLKLSDVQLQAPIRRPPKFLAIGFNYADHVAEAGIETPALPIFFNKQSTCVAGPFDPFHLPRVSPLLDYEGELGVVIGRRCRHVPKERAHEVIAGYLVVNDVSVRDWQLRTPTMTMGKGFDTHGPLGPWLVTADEIGDPHNLDLRTWVNGELRQESNTRHLIFNCFDQIEHLSTSFTLEPGDIISTGTPGGVGGAMQPPRFLAAGDVVRIEIEKIGAIENRVIDEPAETAVI